MKCIDFAVKHWNEVSDSVLQRKWLFIQVITFRLEVPHCCVDQGHKKLPFLVRFGDLWPGARGETGHPRTDLSLT